MLELGCFHVEKIPRLRIRVGKVGGCSVGPAAYAITAHGCGGAGGDFGLLLLGEVVYIW
ncbi:hypothetical protein LF1_00550 [Rubripirellula obstinata]|uniref:Uncharacterized protein n=1 Tax=Rubripirellula obstinata TaxID=406547 RepID=A0A5B1C8U3_9BACT|nr:hypothetical protein LF1_00550 [Rubripirellula obstinata]